MRRFRDVLRTADEIQGVPFAELAAAHGVDWSSDAVRRKGLPGIMSQKCFGVPMDSEPEPDMKDFAIEIKSVPVSLDLKVQEHTKVTTLTPKEVRDHDWRHSRVYHKLRNILFVPVVKPSKEKPGDWYFRTPFIWMPSVIRENQLEKDYEAVRAHVLALKPELISSAAPPEGQGEYLLANTAGKDSKDHIDWGTGGKQVMERRRAWMLRKSFVQVLVDENVRYIAPTNT